MASSFSRCCVTSDQTRHDHDIHLREVSAGLGYE